MLALGKLLELTLAGREPAEKTQLTVDGVRMRWYLDPGTGRNTTLWPGFAYKFRQATSIFSMDDYFAFTSAPGTTIAHAASPHSVHGSAQAAASADVTCWWR